MVGSVFVVSKLEEFERDSFVHPVPSSIGRLGMNVLPICESFLSLTNSNPICLYKLVSAIISREDIEVNCVETLWIHTGD